MKKLFAKIGIGLLVLIVIGGAISLAVGLGRNSDAGTKELVRIGTLEVGQHEWLETTFRHVGLEKIIVRTNTVNSWQGYIEGFNIHVDYAWHIGGHVTGGQSICLHVGWDDGDGIHHSRSKCGWDNLNFDRDLLVDPYLVITTTEMIVFNADSVEVIRLPFGRVVPLGDLEWNLQAHNVTIYFYGGAI